MRVTTGKRGEGVGGRGGGSPMHFFGNWKKDALIVVIYG